MAGNLLFEEKTEDPVKELHTVLSDDSNHDIGPNGLLSLLESQASFGGTIGAAVLLYIGSYALTLTTLGPQGDKATARALAFGIWWMTTVHVAVVSGSLLACNNPSTAAAIVGLRLVRPDQNQGRVQNAWYKRIQNLLHKIVQSCWHKLLMYHTRYQPSWMWSRGKNKALWLKRASIREPDDSFEKVVEIPWLVWAILFATAYLLVFVPCSLAFWIEYRTPPISMGCRLMTILLYMVAQTVFICFSTCSHILALRSDRWLSYLRKKSISISLKVLLFYPSWLLAIFTTLPAP